MDNTFVYYAELFIEQKAKTCSEQYIRILRSALKRHIAPFVGKKGVKAIRYIDKTSIEEAVLLKGRVKSYAKMVGGLFDAMCKFACAMVKEENAQKARKARINYTEGKKRNAVANISIPEDVDLNRLTLVSAFIGLYEKAESPILMEATMYGYQRLDGMITDVIGDKPVSEVTHRDIVAVIQHAAETGSSGPAMVIPRLKRLFSAIKDRNLIDEDPCKDISAPKRPYIPVVCHSPAELKTLSAYFNKQGIYKNILHFAMHAPIPLSRCVALKWSDFKPSTGEITIKYQACSSHDGLGVDFVALPEKKIRTLPLGKAAIADMEAARKMQKKYAQNGTQVVDGGLVFPMPDGSPMSYYTLAGLIPKIQKEAGIRSFTFKSLYRSFGANGLKNGVPVDVVHEQMGYLSRTATENLWLANDDEFDDEAWEDELLDEEVIA